MLETIKGHRDTYIIKTSVCLQGVHNQVGGSRHIKSLSTRGVNFRCWDGSWYRIQWGY